MTVRLGATGIQTSRLGFGCAALVGGRTRTESLHLLESAYEAGIRHFDVARVYGTGDAEAIVGAFARRHGDVTVATKFGIAPLPKTRSTTALKGAVRFATRRSRRAVSLVRRYAGSSVQRSRFDPDSATASLATSLEQLGDRRIDLLLLHDPEPQDWRTPGLRELLEREVASGHVRAYGTATGFAQTQGIVELGSPLPSVLQFEATPNVDEIRNRAPEAGIITFRPFGPLADLRRRVEDEALRALDLDPARMPELLLADALDRNPEGVVLFSASEPARIKVNAGVAEEAPFGADQLDGFRRLCRIP